MRNVDRGPWETKQDKKSRREHELEDPLPSHPEIVLCSPFVALHSLSVGSFSCYSGLCRPKCKVEHLLYLPAYLYLFMTSASRLTCNCTMNSSKSLQPTDHIISYQITSYLS